MTKLKNFAKDKAFLDQIGRVKDENKHKLCAYIKKNYNIDVNGSSIFDMQVKRIHEYKRQLLNVMHVITMYNRMKKNPNMKVVPRTVLIGGKVRDRV